MISFDAGPWRFSLRAAAIIRHGDLVLLHRVGNDPFWALPGGRVEAGETAETAIRREMREELGSEIRIERLEAVVENLYPYRDRPHHGMELHFAVQLPEESPPLGQPRFERLETGSGLYGEPAAAMRLEFRWFHRGELAALDLRPAFLPARLGAPPRTRMVEHIVHRDGTL